MKLHRLGCLLFLFTLAPGAGGQNAPQSGSDFDSLYQAVKAKHDAAFQDLHVDMKEWAPFVVKTLRENDFSWFSSEQLLRLFNLGLFMNLPFPDDDEPLKAFVAVVEERPAKSRFDALLKISVAPQSAKMTKDTEMMSGLYDRLASDRALKDLLRGPHAETLLSALAYQLPRPLLVARPEATRKIAGALPKTWPADWATLAEPLLQTVFTERAIGQKKRETLQAAAVRAMDQYVKENPTGRTADFVKTSRERLTGAAAQGKLIGSAPKHLTFEWCTDPGITRLSNLKGRVVVLDFWATWCGPCLKSVPEVAALQKEFAGFPVTILGVTSLQGYVAGLGQGQINTEGKPAEEHELTKKVMEKVGMTWPTVFTKEPVYNGEFGIEGIPFTAILDPEGKVRFTNLHPGNDHAKIRQHVIDLLKEFKLDHP